MHKSLLFLLLLTSACQGDKNITLSSEGLSITTSLNKDAIPLTANLDGCASPGCASCSEKMDVIEPVAVMTANTECASPGCASCSEKMDVVEPTTVMTANTECASPGCASCSE